MRVFLIAFIFAFCFSPVAIATDSYADLVEKLMPSVVNISTQKAINDSEDNIDNIMLNPEMNGRESLGSGFFIRKDGYILTNYHVIKEAKNIMVTTDGGKNYTAKVIGSDAVSDLAVLKINDKEHAEFHPIIFGDANKIRIGDIVLTFGNPYGLGISVSQGIISAKSRSIGIGEQQYLQTDAAINQGNSGGPMFNMDGEAVGINSAIFTTQGATGIGFSLPSNIANWIATQLIDSGQVKRGWIGVEVAVGIDKYTDKPGFVITEISEESNAYKDGLRVGDIITSYNDILATDINAFKLLVETMNPGQTLRLKFISSGQEIKSVIRIQDMPPSALKSVTNKALSESAKYYHQEADIDAFYISELNITVKEASPRGLVIVKLEKKSPLYNKGVSEGDIILEADNMDIYSSDNLFESIRNAIAGDRDISLFLQGLSDTFYVKVKPVTEND